MTVDARKLALGTLEAQMTGPLPTDEEVVLARELLAALDRIEAVETSEGIEHALRMESDRRVDTLKAERDEWNRLSLETARELSRALGPYKDVPELLAAVARVAVLEQALRDTYGLAAVANEGDGWFAQEAGIDAEAVLERARALLAAAEETKS